MGMTTDELYFKPSLRVINEDQIRQIHAATLEVLERTGIRMPHARGLELLDGAGARVDGNRVRILTWLVEDAIRKAPSRLVLVNAPVKGPCLWKETNPFSAQAWIALIT